jgi:hypothetical protein
MNINRENYEIFYVDYLDGTLSVEEVDLLLGFLKQNPDLKAQLEGIEQMVFEPEKISAPLFNHLKKNDLDKVEVFEETCIRSIENQLSTIENEQFELFLSENLSAKQEYKLFQATILKPDLTLVYPKKNELKKKASRRIPFYWYVAASVLLVAVFMVTNSKVEINSPQVALAPTNEKVIPASQPAVGNAAEPETLASAELVLPLEAKKEAEVKPTYNQQENNEEIAIEYIESINPIKAQEVLAFAEQPEIIDFALAPITKPVPEPLDNYPKYLTLKEYFAMKVNELKDSKTPGIQQFALTSLKKISGEKFSYSTSESGKVEKYEFNSKLLAFTIPVGE